MIAHLTLPWYELWFLYRRNSLGDAANLPFWLLVIVWLFGLMFWIARPHWRQWLTLIGALILLLLPAAALCSFLSKVDFFAEKLAVTGKLDDLSQAAGLFSFAASECRVQLLGFLFLTLFSAVLYGRHLLTSRAATDPGIEASPSQRDDS